MNHSEWFSRFPDLLQVPLFELRVWLGKTRVTIRAYEGPPSEPNHTTIFTSLHGKGIDRDTFPIGWSWVGIPNGKTLDGNYAKEAVLSLYGLKPGDADDEFFAHYTPKQLAFVNQWGEELSMLACYRYGEP